MPEAAHAPAAPRIWRVLGDKRGDNGQVEVIAAALESRLGWSSELRNLEMLPKFVLGKPRVGPTLYHLDRERSDALEPPWPDLILTSGRRPANVALWIKRQSGGRSRIVLVGKPSGCMPQFDLIITSAETLPAPFPNVLRVAMPLMRLDRARVERAAAEWAPRLAAWPRPLVAFLIGGPTNPFVYNRGVTDTLLREARAVLDEGGTPYLVSSRRTPAALVRSLREALPASAQVYDWSDAAADNPYAGLLGLADRFVVTGDSISMMVEVAQQGRPLQIMPLPTGVFGGIDNRRRRLAAWLFQPPRDGVTGEGLRLGLARLAFHAGLMQHTRHFPRFHQYLVDAGVATWVGQPVRQPVPQLPDDLPLIVDTVRGLWSPEVL